MSGEGTKESGQGTSGLQLPSSNISRPYRGAGILQPRGQGMHEAPEMPLASALWRGFSNSLFKGGRGDLEVVSFFSQEACKINNNNTEKSQLSESLWAFPTNSLQLYMHSQAAMGQPWNISP